MGRGGGNMIKSFETFEERRAWFKTATPEEKAIFAKEEGLKIEAEKSEIRKKLNAAAIDQYVDNMEAFGTSTEIIINGYTESEKNA
jgi:hypothetical protein